MQLELLIECIVSIALEMRQYLTDCVLMPHLPVFFLRNESYQQKKAEKSETTSIHNPYFFKSIHNNRMCFIHTNLKWYRLTIWVFFFVHLTEYVETFPFLNVESNCLHIEICNFLDNVKKEMYWVWLISWWSPFEHLNFRRVAGVECMLVHCARALASHINLISRAHLRLQRQILIVIMINADIFAQTCPLSWMHHTVVTILYRVSI